MTDLSNPSPKGPYTPIVKSGNTYFISGQLGLNENRFEEGLKNQVTQALKNAEKLLRAHGLTLKNVVKTTVFLKNIDDYSLMNEAYVEMFGDTRPARSAVGVSGLPLGALVEMELIASSENP